MSKKVAKAARVLPELAVRPRLDVLLDVAAETFLEQGFERTSVGEIARRARASKETFYSKFSSKDELFRSVIRHLMDRFSGEQVAVLALDEEPDKVLRAFGKVMLDRILSDVGLRLQNIVHVESRRFPEIALIFFELGPQRTIAALSRYLAVQIARGTLRKLDTELAASQFMGLLAADLMMRKSLGVSPLPTAQLKARTVSSAVDLFLNGCGGANQGSSRKQLGK